MEPSALTYAAMGSASGSTSAVVAIGDEVQQVPVRLQLDNGAVELVEGNGVPGHQPCSNSHQTPIADSIALMRASTASASVYREH